MAWASRSPGKPESLLRLCLDQDDDTLRGLLAFCVAQTVNAVLLRAATAHEWSTRIIWPKG